MNSNENVINSIEIDAVEGHGIWKKIKNKYTILSKHVVIIMQKKNDNYNKYAIEYLPEFIEKYHYEKAFIITDVDYDCSCEEVQLITIGTDEVSKLERYYRIVQFTDNIVDISRDLPFGTGGIINKEGISERDYVHYALMGYVR